MHSGLEPRVVPFTSIVGTEENQPTSLGRKLGSAVLDKTMFD